MLVLRAASLFFCFPLAVAFVQAGAFHRNQVLSASTATASESMPEVKVGDKIPPVVMMEGLEDFGKQEINLVELIAGKKVAIFGVPGAFTPGTSLHLSFKITGVSIQGTHPTSFSSQVAQSHTYRRLSMRKTS